MKKWFSDIANQIWTLLGMFVAWVVLDGSAKTIVGYGVWIPYMLKSERVKNTFVK